MIDDRSTAAAFASSWNALPQGSVYTGEQFQEWLLPIEEGDVKGRAVLELGCGNASLLTHLAKWAPARIKGVELGSSVQSARLNMSATGHQNWSIDQADLTAFTSDGFDLVYCIGVLHHLEHPSRGLDAVIRNTKPGGRFHCWVYGREGNTIVRLIVEPIRRVCWRLPWWLTKYIVATPLAIPFFIYARTLVALPRFEILKLFPLYDYSLWIAKREFGFFRHVAFDQLVTPRTTYFPKETIERWLSSYSNLKPESVYIIRRNGNSWKFGGMVASPSDSESEPRPRSAKSRRSSQCSQFQSRTTPDSG